MYEITHHDLFVVCEDWKKIELAIEEVETQNGYTLNIQARGKVYTLVTAKMKVRIFRKMDTLIEYVKSIKVENKKITIKLQE